MDLPELDVAKLLSGAFGAVVSWRWIKGTFAERALMVLGGGALSYYGTDHIALWLKMESAVGLVGFLLGLFGMAILSKVYEVLTLLDAKKIAADVWEWFARKWRA